MSEQLNKGSEGQENTAIDKDKFVPKEELEKVQKASSEQLEKVKSELEQAKLSLLDPEYISYLESKKARAEKQVDKIPDDTDLNKLSPKQLLDIAVSKAVEAVNTQNSQRFTRVESAVSNVLAIMELQATEKRYNDFDDYRDDIKDILSDPQNSGLTYDTAYKLAKQNRAEKGDDKGKEVPAKKSKGEEKPTGAHPISDFKPKNFKNANDASDDAWDQVVGSAKDRL